MSKITIVNIQQPYITSFGECRHSKIGIYFEKMVWDVLLLESVTFWCSTIVTLCWHCIWIGEHEAVKIFPSFSQAEGRAIWRFQVMEPQVKQQRKANRRESLELAMLCRDKANILRKIWRMSLYLFKRIIIYKRLQPTSWHTGSTKQRFLFKKIDRTAQ